MKILYMLMSLLVLASSSIALGSSCSVTPPTVIIGQYDPITNPGVVQAQFFMMINCTTNTSYTITAGPSGVSGSYIKRQMVNDNTPGSRLDYVLCLDPWGSTCDKPFGTPPQGYAMVGKGSAQLAFSAKVPPNQPAVGGWYRDYVQITISP